MRRTLLGLLGVLGLIGVCMGSAWLGSNLALDRLVPESLPVDLRSELEVDYYGGGAPSKVPPLDPGVSQQAQQDEVRLAVQFSIQDLEFVPVYSSLPDWEVLPTPHWLPTRQAVGPPQELAVQSTPPPGTESGTEASPFSGSSTERVVHRLGPYPDADTYIAEDAGSTNYSGADELHVSNAVGRRERILIDINPVGLTGPGVLERALLHIYTASFAGAGEWVTVHRVTAPWDPTTATWDSESGGEFVAEAASSIDISSTGWKVLDITPLMQEWLEGSSGSYGIILTAPSAGEDIVVTIYSGNYPDPLLRPWVEVSFVAASDP